MGEAGEKRIHMLNHKWHDVESVEDVFADILSRLPVDCLLECKLVSKYWNRVTKGATFIDMQLRRSREMPVFLLYHHEDDKLISYLLKSDGEVIKEITFPIRGRPCCQTLVCSVDGLVCCLNHSLNSESDEIGISLPNLEIRIYNPATQEVQLLPEGSPSEEMPAIGFAFGPRINDYKVFRFFYAKRESEALDKECEVYSSSSGSWRHIGKVPHIPMRSCFVALGFDHVSVKGKVFWFIASEEDRTIPAALLTVDTEERFETLSLPVDDATMQSYLVVLEGHLALIIVDDEGVSVWSLEDCQGPTWTERFSGHFPFTVMDFIHGVAARKNEIFFMTSEADVLKNYILNLDDLSWKKLPFGDLDEKDYPGVLTYVESLLSCGG